MLMKKRLLSRRGAAIELAIAVIFLMMALSIILVSVATMQGAHRKKDIAELENKVELWEIGEHVCENRVYYKTNNEVMIENNYTVKYDGGTKYEIYEGSNVVLTIEIDDDGNITSWN